MPALSNALQSFRRRGPNPVTNGDAGWMNWPFWNTRSIAGPSVTDESALSLPAFYRGVTLMARTLAGMTPQVFEETIDGEGVVGETRKIKTPETSFIWSRANEERTLFDFWQDFFADEIRGNAFIWVEKGRLDRPRAMWNVPRHLVRVGRTRSGLKVYEVETQDGPVGMIDYKQGGEIVHVKNWGRGLVGYDPIKVGKEALALGMSAQEYAARYFPNDGVPPGYLTTQGELSQEESEAISDAWHKQGGLTNAHKIRVLSHGSKFEQLLIDAEKSQLLAVRKFSVADVARLLGLYPWQLGDMDHASQGGGNGLEEQNRTLVTFNFDGHLIAAEQAVSDDLLVRELTGRYMRFNRDAVLRGTTLQRYQALRLADFMTFNEKRALEGLPPIEGGDELAVPSNTEPIDEWLMTDTETRPTATSGQSSEDRQ